MNTKEKRLTLDNESGCKRLIALLLCIILAASFCARLITTNFGSVKVERLAVDVRGGTMDMEIYYPAGTSDKEKLPAVVISHGGGIQMTSYRQFAQELARRGFVAVMVNAYANGYSEQPKYEESGVDMDQLDYYGFFADSPMSLSTKTALGLYDAINYVRTLKFVDADNICLAGHSMGALRTCFAAYLDCYYYSYNDIMINVLYNEFGQKFTKEEITADAATLAAARLNADQLKEYEYLAKEYRDLYDTRIKSLCLIGMYYSEYLDPQTLQVAGYDVTRTLKANVCYVDGTYEDFTVAFHGSSSESYKTAFQTKEDVKANVWYAVDDLKDAGTALGTFKQTTAAENTVIAAAADSRSIRMFTTSAGTHSEMYLSTQATASVLEYCQLTLGVKSSLSIHNQTWPIRTACNTIAMFAMLALAFPLVALLSKKKCFASILGREVSPDMHPAYGRKTGILAAAGTVVFSYLAVYLGNRYMNSFMGIGFLMNTKVFRLTTLLNAGRIFIFLMAVVSAVFVGIYAVRNKKRDGSAGLAALNFKMKVTDVLKAILAAAIVLAVQYATLMVIEYLFAEDYRLWQTSFTEVRPERWFFLLPYILMLFPCYIASGAATNCIADRRRSEWKDTLYIVLINSAGVWLALITNVIQTRFFFNGTFFIDFKLIYCLNLLVPVTVYISRKMYNITRQLWTGAMLNTLLICWTWVSCSGVFTAGQNWLSNFLAS